MSNPEARRLSECALGHGTSQQPIDPGIPLTGYNGGRFHEADSPLWELTVVRGGKYGT